MKYQHLFFDLDRTLWDYDSNSRQSLTAIYEKYGLSTHFKDPEEFWVTYNKHNDRLWDDYRKGTILKDELRHKRFRLSFAEKGLINESLAVSAGDHYMEITPKMNLLFPHAIETLEYLKERGYNLYILTNGFLGTQEMKMQQSGLDGYFERIFSSEEIGINKPHREIFHWAVSSLNALKSTCVMIGDDYEVDIRGAQDYGLDAIWFNPSFNEQAAMIPVIKDLLELKGLL